VSSLLEFRHAWVTYKETRSFLTYLLLPLAEYYQLEEMEDKDTCTTELFLRADGVIEFGDTDGPQPNHSEGRWTVPDGTNDYSMEIKRRFGAGQSNTDVGEFDFVRKCNKNANCKSPKFRPAMFLTRRQ